jgi:hypothetical protein
MLTRHFLFEKVSWSKQGGITLQECESTEIAAHPVQHLEYNLLIKLPGRFLI